MINDKQATPHKKEMLKNKKNIITLPGASTLLLFLQKKTENSSLLQN